MTHKNENIHALGNGRIGAYECGPDIIQVFGPPYSAPTLGSLVTESGDSEWVSSREPGAAIWIHTSPFGLLHDFVASSDPVLVRKIDASAPLNFTLQLNPASRVSFSPNASHLTCEIPAGVFFYPPYPYPRPVFYRLAWEGEVQPRRTDEHTFCFECLPGHSRLFICGGPEYPQAVENLEAAQSTGVADLLAGTRAAWQAYATAHAVWQDRLPAALPQRSRLLQAIDDVAVLIRAQQSSEGGVLAGHNYHLCYVRDQYGVSRGLLALGHTAEAQAILEYYWQIWQRHGRICNAQAAGVDGVFHIHENDEVEITGYLIRQAFDLQQAGVEGVVERVFPMLTWAWEAQKKHLISNMLPFNGDETYVAGGILPRTALNDGSAEATLLFLDSGEKLLSWAEFAGVGMQIAFPQKDLYWPKFGLLTGRIFGMMVACGPITPLARPISPHNRASATVYVNAAIPKGVCPPLAGQNAAPTGAFFALTAWLKTTTFPLNHVPSNYSRSA